MVSLGSCGMRGHLKKGYVNERLTATAGWQTLCLN